RISGPGTWPLKVQAATVWPSLSTGTVTSLAVSSILTVLAWAAVIAAPARTRAAAMTPVMALFFKPAVVIEIGLPFTIALRFVVWYDFLVELISRICRPASDTWPDR